MLNAMPDVRDTASGPAPRDAERGGDADDPPPSTAGGGAAHPDGEPRPVTVVLPVELEERLRLLARLPQLLVCCDFDGVLAPIVTDPMQASPRRESVVAMRALADLPQTHVAVVSGRSLRDLATLSRLPEEIRLVGSHGSEFDVDWAADLPGPVLALRKRINHELTQLADRIPGAYAEQKPTGVAFHFRNADADLASLGVEEILAGPAQLDGVHVKHGKAVVELSVVETSKGSAIDELRRQVGASAVLFVGDDVTDEDGFATLSGPDVGVKVGGGRTRAHFRVEGTEAVSRLLAVLAEHRSGWLMGSAAVPIVHHSFLSDRRTAAIVGPDARIRWFCVPRIDSAAVFAELIGGPAGGYFAVGPDGGGMPTDQRYVGDSLVLQSTWPRLTVLDYLDCSGGRPARLAGRSDLVRVLDGEGPALVEFAPRLDFGRVATRLEAGENGVEVLGTTDLMVLRSAGVSWEIVEDGIHQTAKARVELDAGPVVLELRCGTASLASEPVSESERRSATVDYWRGWADELDVPSIEPDLVRRSALVLRGLSHGPTGAVVAAATTSLPERIGGVRNWDYRYCWLRHAALASAALVRLGSDAEAMAFLDFVLGVLDQRGEPDRLPAVLNVTGRHLPPEAEISDLPGYAGSRPVRVGNASDGQIQLDVFGCIVELVHLLARRGAPLSAEHWHLVESMVSAVSHRWKERDHGMWEVRTAPRHHTYSKAMCWLTLDRAIDVSVSFRGSVERSWEDLRETIRSEVLEQGWKPRVGAFTAAYEGEDLDAAVLALGLFGLVDLDDRRFVSTVEVLEHVLREGPTVYRYKTDDGLPGRGSGFHLMTSWLIDAYQLVGRRDDALELFGNLVDRVGPTGLLSEAYDPVTGRALGNIPQAYSHLGLINNALNLDGRRD
jgi:trehalose 6-phosphate phosphatase